MGGRVDEDHDFLKALQAFVVCGWGWESVPDWSSFRRLSQAVCKVSTTLNISSATSASDFTISNHKRLVFPLSCCCMPFLAFMRWSLGIHPSEMFWKYTNDLKDRPYRVPHYFIHHLGRYWGDPWETPKVIWGFCPALCSSLFLCVILLASNGKP